MRTAAVAIVLLSILGAAIAWAVNVWTSLGNVPMSIHGEIALVLMIVFSMIVGFGLMALVFFSSRKGYDEAARDRQRPRLEHDPQRPRPRENGDGR